MAHGYQDRYDCLYIKMSSYRIDFLFGVFVFMGGIWGE